MTRRSANDVAVDILRHAAAQAADRDSLDGNFMSGILHEWATSNGWVSPSDHETALRKQAEASDAEHNRVVDQHRREIAGLIAMPRSQRAAVWAEAAAVAEAVNAVLPPGVTAHLTFPAHTSTTNSKEHQQ